MTRIAEALTGGWTDDYEKWLQTLEDDVSSVDRYAQTATACLTSMPKADPADLRDASLRPFGVQAPGKNLTTLESNSIVLTSNPELRKAGAPLKEVLKSLIKITQRLILRRPVSCAQPITLGAKRGQFTALARQIDPMFSPPIPPLCQRQIVNKPGRASEAFNRFALFCGRIKLEAEATKHLPTIPQLSTVST